MMNTVFIIQIQKKGQRGSLGKPNSFRILAEIKDKKKYFKSREFQCVMRKYKKLFLPKKMFFTIFHKLQMQ